MPFKLEKPERLQLVNSIKLLDEVDELCKKGAACGFDMRAHDMAAQALRARVDAIRREFSPTKRD